MGLGRFGVVGAVAAAFVAGALLGGGPPAADARGDDEIAAAVRGVYFSPGGGIEAGLLDAIKDAKAEVLVAMFNFTSRPLAEALGRAKQRGVDVRVIHDRSQAFVKYGKVNDLRRSKVPVRLMNLGKTGDDQQIRFHHKFMVVDREVVATGSYNWTSQADESNWENEVIFASKKVAALFREQFEKAWQRAEEEPPTKKATSD